MRRFVPVVSTVAIVSICLGVDQVPGFAQARTADSVMAAARTALGGEAKIAGVKTFIATGRTKQVRGENLVPIEFEIQAELPDKYSRRDEFPAQDAGPVTAGFVADALVLIPRPAPPPPRPGMPAPPAGAMEAQLRARMMQAKQDFARLMLGMFAGTTAAFPVTYAYVGQAEAPQGKADVIDVKGPGEFLRAAVRRRQRPADHVELVAARRTDGTWRPRWSRRNGASRRSASRRRWSSPWRSAPRCRASDRRPGWSSPRSQARSRAAHLLRGLSRCRRLEAALPHPARRRHGDDRGNNFRSLPDQREG